MYFSQDLPKYDLKSILIPFLKTLFLVNIWNTSRICISSLGRSHANLCIIPILLYLLPRYAMSCLSTFIYMLLPFFFYISLGYKQREKYKLRKKKSNCYGFIILNLPLNLGLLLYLIQNLSSPNSQFYSHPGSHFKNMTNKSKNVLLQKSILVQSQTNEGYLICSCSKILSPSLLFVLQVIVHLMGPENCRGLAL